MTRKIILSTVAAATLLTTSASALTLEERIAKLEKIISTQQSTIKKLSSSVAPDLAEDVEELDERLEIIETRSYTDKISLGLGMRVEANSVDTKKADGTSPANEGMIWRTKLNINMKSKIADNLKFSGRLSMYKNWGDSSVDNNAYATIDSRQGRTPDNFSTVYVERAYLDWTTNVGSEYPFIVTMGRQPSSDGPSHHIKEGMSRKGTYDALLFDGAVDGLVFTSNLSKATDGYTAVRLAYMMAANNSQSTPLLKDATVTGVFVDKTLDTITQSHLFQVYYTQGKNFNADTSGTQASDVTVGGFDHMGAMFEIQNIGKFDFFAHYARSEAKPNGTLWNGMGLLTNTSGDTTVKSGNAYWLGAKYNASKDWAIGAEYNKGSQNWFSYTYAPSDPLNKLAARGNAVEVYATKAINKYSNIRFGYVDIDYKYRNSGAHLGTATEIISSTTDNNGNSAIQSKKNAYITFNVLF